MVTANSVIPSQKVEVNIEKEKESSKQKIENYPQMPPHFIPKEGYELIGTLVKVDPTLAKYLFKLLKGAELVPDENSPTGFREQKLKGVEPFCNDDGVDKITDLILLHINTPLSYKEKGQTPSQIAGQIAKQFIKDTAANFEHWEIQNPSLIPQIAAVVFQFIKAAQGQNTDLPEGLLSGGALRPPANTESSAPTKPKFRLL
ncbi:MAG: hypothetical protein QXS81_01145 [Candidatus Micrarchaeaceae archaeon]